MFNNCEIDNNLKQIILDRMLEVQQNKRKVVHNSKWKRKFSQEAGHILYHPKHTDKQLGE